ncbi:PD40 domain-containing protein [Solirubrobacter soli]|uniref:PD40 domain-containing protein n=1 Tax=Solirubrobacter soli TaxID=363832 RepID=UPI0004265CE1|nr:PD40 domain-containing protein [Solirubrobacter soli]
MKKGFLALAVSAAVLAAPAVASADSIVFVKDYNVWLVSPDGSKLTQVTTDGSYEHPYLSPSQADDGTIAVSKGTKIVRLRQNGEVINELDPAPLMDSISHPLDGVPVDVAISPDGTKIGYTFVSYSCPIGASCGARYATGYTAADHLTPPEQLSGNLFTRNPSWVGNTRTLSSAGYLHQVNTHDLGPGTTDVHWFDDQDLVGQANSTDLDDAELNRQGDMLAVLRGYGADTRLLTLKVGAAPPAVPTMMCLTSKDEKFGGPSWAPDGRRLVVADSFGLEIAGEHPASDADCDKWAWKEFIAGGSEPDWGPADVNPQPRVTPTPTPTPSPTPTPPPAVKPALSVNGAKLKAALKSGLVVKVTGVPGTVKVTASISKSVARKAKLGKKAMTVASGSAKAGADVRLKFTKQAAKRLAKLRSVTLTVNGGGVSRTVTLKA